MFSCLGGGGCSDGHWSSVNACGNWDGYVIDDVLESFKGQQRVSGRRVVPLRKVKSRLNIDLDLGFGSGGKAHSGFKMTKAWRVWPAKQITRFKKTEYWEAWKLWRLFWDVWLLKR